MITNNFSRSILSEGRCYGFGFSVLDKISDTDFNTMMAFTCCKDYINDFVYVEQTGEKLEKVYGFSHDYTGKLKDQEYFYLGIRPLHFADTRPYTKFDELSDLIKSNNSNLITFLNKLEELFKLETFTILDSIQEDVLILKVPIFWAKFGFLISLYTLYIRCFMNITKEELTEDIHEIFINHKVNFMMEDNMLYEGSKKAFEADIFNELLNYKFPGKTNSHHIHNFGISGRISEITKKLNKIEITC